MNEFNLSEKAFRLSLKVVELYVHLLKNGEFELAEKILKSAVLIREKMEESFSALTKEDSISALSMAYNSAVQTRFWLKNVQMKHDVNTLCDDSVESINEIITILNYIGTENNEYKLNFQYQMN